MINILTLPEAAPNPGRLPTMRRMTMNDKLSLAHATPTLSLRASKISVNLILSSTTKTRSTKIVCTMGPKCWSEEGLSQLLDAGMDVARFNLSHGNHQVRILSMWSSNSPFKCEEMFSLRSAPLGPFGLLGIRRSGLLPRALALSS